MRSKKQLITFVVMSIFVLSLSSASTSKTETNNARNQLESYVFAYVIHQHVLRSKENKSKGVAVGIGDYVDGELGLPKDEVMKELASMFPEIRIGEIQFQEGSRREIERKAKEIIVTVDIITFSGSGEGEDQTISGVVEVHCNYGPLNGFGEAYLVAYYDGTWAITLLRQLYVSYKKAVITSRHTQFSACGTS